MEEKGSRFPNGQLKSQLYESLLRHSDFDCGPDKYAEDVAFLKELERTNQPICSWVRDIDGRRVVTQLSLASPHVRIEITKSGFRRIPVASAKTRAALIEQAKTIEQLKALFTPRAAIEHPLQFVGRKAQIQQILSTDLSRGGIFLILGERSAGKTSLVHMLKHLFERNTELLEYYDLPNLLGRQDYRVVCADISGGLATVEELAAELGAKLRCDTDERKESSSKIMLGAPGIVRFEQSSTFKPMDELPVSSVTIRLKTLRAGGERPVAILDEFDFFTQKEALAPILRTWVSNGLICFLVGSEETFHSLIAGHISLARDVNRIEIGPMLRDEFREMFYVAAMRCANAIQFDTGALNALYEAAGGLPYFGQLFGFILLDNAARRFVTFDHFIAAGRSGSSVLISDNEVRQIIEDLPLRCTQLEVQARLLEDCLPEGRRRLLEIAHGTYSVPIGTAAAASTLPVVFASAPQALRQLRLQGSHVYIDDPVLRRYVLLTRSPH